MRWLPKPKKSPLWFDGQLREKVVFAFWPVKTTGMTHSEDIDSPDYRGWTEQWIWLEWVVRIDQVIFALKPFSLKETIHWKKGVSYYPLPEYEHLLKRKAGL